MRETSKPKTPCDHDCGLPTALDVTVKDRNGAEITFGSIVEVIPWGGDAARDYHGLWYVHAFEVKQGKTFVLVGRVAKGRGPWELQVRPGRLSLRCFRPMIAKGE